MSKQRLSLAEQIAQLADPRPSSFHPDEDERDQLGAVSLSYAREDSEGDDSGHVQQRSSLRVSWEDDPRYAGRPITRKELEQDEEEYSAAKESGEESVSEESDDSLEDQSSDLLPIASDGDQSNSTTHLVKEEVEQPFSTLSAQSIQDELEKSHAVKHQTELWDKLLETRIHLHKVLPLSNRLPQHDVLPVYKKAGRTTLSDALSTNESSLRALLDQLLELQQCLLHQNTETRTVVDGRPEEEVDEEDEEILSDEAEGSMDEDDRMEDNTTIAQAARIGKRKRRRDWELVKGGRDYESYISGIHERLNPFVYGTIDKWNKKLRLTSDKTTSKSFIQVDKSVVGQIRHILLDKQRLVRRTQLKRSLYRVLGKYDTEREEQEETDDRSKSKDYSEEIFDDDDFYHQLLRNLIERRMSATESTDTIAMGRDWLQLQQLRSKVKRKTVDTKASKGRKLRYEVHQKLVSFTSPVDQGTMPDTARNDLFASLFGARSAAARQHQY